MSEVMNVGVMNVGQSKESSGKPKFVLVIGMIGTMQRQIIQKFSGGGEGIFR